MKRLLSHVLIVAGLVLAGFGLSSMLETHQEQGQAEAEWDRETAAPSAHSLAGRQLLPGRKTGKGALIARLSIKRLNSHWIVVEGAGRAELRRGAGHVVETAFPGDDGNCVIAGHRDTQFRVLRNVKLGESITLESYGRKYVYRVVSRAIIAPTDTTSLRPTPISMLTLITCYPFYYVGPAPKRFVVRAEFVSSFRSKSFNAAVLARLPAQLVPTTTTP